MARVKFSKFHGFGNDYIVIEVQEFSDIEDISLFAKMICERNTGVGGDGIALIKKVENGEADYSCRIINPDGGEAGFSGNGTRCAVAYLHCKGLWNEKNLRLKTKSGIKVYDFLKRDGNSFWFRAELGKPKFALDEIPFIPDSDSDFDNGDSPSSHELQLSEQILQVNVLNVGNPVAAVFVEDFTLDWRKLGAEIEFHPQFPESTNVVFVKVIDQENIDIRIWERGAGETSSSGTCSIAAAVASVLAEKTSRRASVHAPGGITETQWRDDDEMLITGSAEFVFSGEWFTN